MGQRKAYLSMRGERQAELAQYAISRPRVTRYSKKFSIAYQLEKAESLGNSTSYDNLSGVGIICKPLKAQYRKNLLGKP